MSEATTLTAEAAAAIGRAQSNDELARIEQEYLGRKSGRLSRVLANIGQLPPAEKATLGKDANEAKRAIEAALAARRAELETARLADLAETEAIDITFPGPPANRGHIHVLTQVRRQIETVLESLGYQVELGPEVETEWYNFEALNISQGHPARENWDSFYFSPELLLRAHTSPVQIRAMQRIKEPPIYIITPGRCYRRDAPEATRLPYFSQVEGLAVDKGLTVGDMKGTLLYMIQSLYGRERKVRVRPSYFPFTEPSFEFDVSCGICLRLGLRHRAHGDAQARRGRHPPLLRVRPALPRAVLMRISYEWLGDFLDLDGVTPKDAADVLTRLGVEVESLVMVDLSQIVIGKVLEQNKHPKSRNDLWVHQVELGGRTQQIIAGAPNAVPGSLVPVALPGTTVPNGKVVKDMNIAGYQASGMLCSAAELLLGDDHSGILILDSGTPGDPLTTVIPSQAIMEAEITSNRPDEMGHLGIARELAAGLDRPVKRDFMPSFTGTASPAGRDLVKVTIEDPSLCSRYIGAVIKGAKVGPSPSWLQRRLRACGVRPINNIVDITNYVLLEYAQPLHAFDMAKLSGPEIQVRRARDHEKLLGLDGVTRDLTPDMLVIADAERPVALAGVIGGEESAVTSTTTDLLLESANFNGPNVRQTSRTIGLRTEASARFERALPPELALAGARRAASLIAELTGGTVHRDWADVYPRPQEPIRVNLQP